MRTRLLLVAVSLASIAVIAGLSYFYQQRQTAARRLAAWRELQTDRQSDRLVVAVHPLPPLESSADAEQWVELIKYTIAPHTWDDRGGPAHLTVVPGGLVVRHTTEVQRQIATVFSAFADRDEQPQSLEPLWLLPDKLGALERRIHSALAEPSALDCVDRPLCEVVQELSRRHAISIALNLKCLDDAGIDPAMRVTMQLRGLTLRSLLRLLLRKCDLTYVVRNGLLQISTPDDADCQEVLVAYPVGDLATPDEPALGFLVDLITTCVAPQSWGFSGPTPDFAFGDHWLVIPQSPEVHERIADFLTRLRRKLSPAEADVLWPLTVAEQNEQRIAAALDRPLALRLENTPLEAACRQLQSELGVPVVIDERSVRHEEPASRLPVSCDPTAGPARDVLRAMLAQRGLNFRTANEVIEIVSSDYREDPPTQIFDVRPLLTTFSERRLPELIRTLATPKLVATGGDYGWIDEFRGLLIVRETEANVRRVGRVIQALNALGRTEHKAGQSKPWVIPLAPETGLDHLERLLQTPASVDFCGLPLDLALAQLAAEYDFRVWLNPRSIGGDERFYQWPPVYLETSELTLGNVLSAMLWPLGLDYMISDGVICVSDPPDAGLFDPRLYRIPVGKDRQLWLARLKLLDGVTTNPPWDPQHGLAIGTPVTPDWFAISADWQGHQRIADWLFEQRTGQTPPWAIQRRRLEAEFPRRLDAASADEDSFTK